MMQNRALRIGITGGIATGKSTVTAYLRGKGYCVLDADRIYHRLIEPGKPLYQALVKQYGPKIIRRGVIDRHALSHRIFQDAQERDRLNRLTHPAVLKEMVRQADELEKAGAGPIFFDIPLLFELGEQRNLLHLDRIWLIASTLKHQTERLERRDSLDHEQAKLRIQSQYPVEKKRKLADNVFDNDGEEEELYRQLDRALETTGGAQNEEENDEDNW